MEWSVNFGKDAIRVTLPARIPDDIPFQCQTAGQTVTLRWQKATGSFFIQEKTEGACIVERPLPIRFVALDRRADEGKTSVDLELGTNLGQALSAVVSRYAFGQEHRDKASSAKGATIRSPMTGKVLKVLATNRANVSAGDTIFIIEAMKMENKIAAPISGIISGIKLKEGDLVTVNAKLAQIG